MARCDVFWSIMEVSKPIKMWGRKVMYGWSDYGEGIVLLRFEKHGKSYYTEQKIHIDKKAIDFIKEAFNNGNKKT